MTDGNNEWYTNKEIFEMIQSLKDELQTTREAVKKYNDLRQNINDLNRKWLELEGRNKGKKVVEDTVLRWGGWFVGILGLLLAIVKTCI